MKAKEKLNNENVILSLKDPQI